MFKKITAAFAAIILTVSCLASCGSGGNAGTTAASGSTDTTASTGEKLDVIVTNFPPYDFVREIAGDKVELTQLIAPGSQSHTYEPSTSELLKIQNCDLFIYTGGEGDVWVDTILSSLETDGVKVLTMMECVELLSENDEGIMESEEHEDEGEGEEVEYDAHVWTSPKRAIQIVNKICEALCSLDAANADYYTTNAEEYTSALSALDMSLTQLLSSATGDTIVVADRFPFRYLANDYGIKYYAAFMGCSSDTSDASAATVKNLIDLVDENRIPVVFYIEFSNEAMADTIAEATGAQKALLHSCHNISQEDFDSGKTYLSIMTDNLTALSRALNY